MSLTVYQVKKELNEYTKDQMPEQTAMRMAVEFQKVIGDVIDKVDMEELEGELIHDFKGLKLIRAENLDDISGYGGQYFDPEYSPKWTFTSSDGSKLDLSAVVRELKGEGPEIITRAVIFRGNDESTYVEKWIAEAGLEEQYDAFIIDNYSLSYAYDVSRKKLTEEQLQEIGKQLGMAC